MRNVVGVLIVSLVMVACGKTQPQRPTFHGEEMQDTATVQLLTMNQQMAAQADLQLTRMVTSDYVLMDENYWVKGLYPQKDHMSLLQDGEYISYEAEFFSLKDHLLTSHQASVKMGQVDDIPAIARVLPLMQHGQRVTMLVPWYMAFGSVGNAQVAPYENIRVELYIE